MSWFSRFTTNDYNVLNNAVSKMISIHKKINEELDKSELFKKCPDNIKAILRKVIIKEILNDEALLLCKCLFKNLQEIYHAYKNLKKISKAYEKFNKTFLGKNIKQLNDDIRSVNLNEIIESIPVADEICDDEYISNEEDISKSITFSEKLDNYIKLCFIEINDIYKENNTNINELLYQASQYINKGPLKKSDYYFQTTEFVSGVLHDYFSGEIDKILNDTIYPENIRDFTKYYGGKRIRKQKTIRKRKQKTIRKRKQKTIRKIELN